MKLYLGVDPGQTGAIAVMSGGSDYDGHAILSVVDYPGDERSTSDLIDTLINPRDILPKDALPGVQFELVVCAIEHQQAFKGQGISSTGKLMKNFGEYLGILAAKDIPTLIVRPQQWKVGLIPPKAKKTESLTVARRLYPSLAPLLKRQKDHGRADALLIARYGMFNYSV